MVVDRAVQELNEAFKQSGLVDFLTTVLLVLEILRIFALVNVRCLPISFETDPLGLIQRFTKKENESDEQAWKRCFCCIFDILWVVTKMTKPCNSAFNLPLLLDTWLCVLFAGLTWHVTCFAMQLGIRLLCNYLCAI